MIILELMEFGDLKNFLIDHKYDIVCLMSPHCIYVMIWYTPSQLSYLKGYVQKYDLSQES